MKPLCKGAQLPRRLKMDEATAGSLSFNHGEKTWEQLAIDMAYGS